MNDDVIDGLTRAEAEREKLTIERLVEESYETSRSKGWHDPGSDATVGDRIALMHSELSEALECYRDGDPLDRIYYVGENENGKGEAAIDYRATSVASTGSTSPGPCGSRWRSTGPGLYGTEERRYETLPRMSVLRHGHGPRPLLHAPGAPATKRFRGSSLQVVVMGANRISMEHPYGLVLRSTKIASFCPSPELPLFEPKASAKEASS